MERWHAVYSALRLLLQKCNAHITFSSPYEYKYELETFKVIIQEPYLLGAAHRDYFLRV
jgi:hypothetical protein